MHQSDKDSETTKENITHLAVFADLDNDEKKMLWNICHSNHAKNIEFLYKDTESLNALFKSEYSNLIQDKKSSQKIATLFSLRFKLEKAHDKSLTLKSTREIKSGMNLIFYDSNGMPWTLTIAASNKNEMILAVPDELKDSDLKPKNLGRFDVVYYEKADLTYLCTLRVTRYEITNENVMIMYTNHSDSLQVIQRRKAKRMNLESICAFSAVKMIEGKKNQELQILEKKYKGLLTDISAGGCSIICPMPIVKNQYIQVFFQLENLEKHECTGIIVDTKKTRDGMNYVLHIKFINIEVDVANEIYAFIYGYIN